GRLLARGRSRSFDRYPPDANCRAGDGARTELVTGRVARAFWTVVGRTGPALWPLGKLGEPAAGAGPRAPRFDSGASPPGRDGRARGSEISGALGARQPAGLSGTGGSDRGNPPEQSRPGDPLHRLSDRQLGDASAPARSALDFSEEL